MNVQKLRILLVDDDPFLTNLLARHFQQEGVQHIKIVQTREECLTELSNVDLVILDYYLDDGNGIDILKEIKSQNQDIPVIFLSGQEYVNIAIRSLKYGAFDYLEKSKLNFDKLMDVITRAVEYQQAFKKEQRLNRIKHFFTLGLI